MSALLVLLPLNARGENLTVPVSNLTPSPPAAGTILAGKYRVERVIGQGGMGIVLEAHHIALEERVALKLLLPEHGQRPDASARFLREARAAAKIKSEHVARVSDVGALDDGSPYMVMEFLSGSDLSQLLQRSGVLSVADAVDYVIQGCEAIAEAHARGIVHRDLKPANLFLSRRPNGTAIVKVLDFGISKMADASLENLTKTTAAMGSALYMSPEQMQSTRGVDHRTDIYALGIALYELLAGKQPYYADTLPQLCAEIFTGTPTPLRSLRSDVPEELALVLEKAYARDRGQRYASIADFVIALAPFAPLHARPMIEGIAKLGGLAAPVIAVAGPPSPTPPVAQPAQPASVASVVPRAAQAAPKPRASLIPGLVLGILCLGGLVVFVSFRSPRQAVLPTAGTSASVLPPVSTPTALDSTAPSASAPAVAVPAPSASAVAVVPTASSAEPTKKTRAPGVSAAKPPLASANPFSSGERK